MRSLRFLLARWLAPEVFDRSVVRITADTSQAVAALEILRDDIARVAALADDRRVACDLHIAFEVRA